MLDRKGKLVGIVLERDLLYASPSPATSLSVYELNYLVAKITIGELMTKSVITVDDDCPSKRPLASWWITTSAACPSCAEALVGMITESDLFRVFLEMLGAREGVCASRSRCPIRGAS